METSSGTTETLTELVQRFRVCWEVWPEYTWVGRQRRQTGLTLELSGTHVAGVQHPTPGCPHCQTVYAALQRIARHILPREHRPSSYDLGTFDHAIHYSPMRRNRPDISLAITVLHRENLDEPLSACQERCVQDMKQRLREIGAREGGWAPREGGR